jgi:hypothetical protein
MKKVNTKEYNIYLLIVIIIILFFQFASNVFRINTDIKDLIIDLLFAIAGLIILFGWELKIFIILNIFGFLKFNIGLITNDLIKSDLIAGELDFNLQMTKWIMTVITFAIVIAGFQSQIRLGTWKDKIEINRKKVLIYYFLGSIVLQIIIKLIL